MCTCITGTWTYVGVQASIQGLTYDTESTHSRLELVRYTTMCRYTRTPCPNVSLVIYRAAVDGTRLCKCNAFQNFLVIDCALLNLKNNSGLTTVLKMLSFIHTADVYIHIDLKQKHIFYVQISSAFSVSSRCEVNVHSLYNVCKLVY